MTTANGNELEMTDRVVNINRVAKVVKGGRRFSFSAIVVVGDGNGRVGHGLGKAKEVPEAIRKGVEQAKRSLIQASIVNGTISCEVIGRFGASKVFLSLPLRERESSPVERLRRLLNLPALKTF